jgi:MYXO-CTERM domain-containing protein
LLLAAAFHPHPNAPPAPAPPPGGFLGALAVALVALALLHRRRSRRLVWARPTPPAMGGDLEEGDGGLGPGGTGG